MGELQITVLTWFLQGFLPIGFQTNKNEFLAKIKDVLKTDTYQSDVYIIGL